MTKAKGRTRRERRLADMTVQPPPDPPRPDDDPEEEWACDEQKFVAYCGLEGFEAQVVQVVYHGVRTRRLRKFAVMLQVRREGTDEGWVDVVRVDCAHGYAHVDTYRRTGPRRERKQHDPEAVPEAIRDDLDAALQWAMSYIWDTEERMARWA